jgi:nucleoside-diphosphate-sugar epimerase
MRVAVTGAGGFIGGHLVNELRFHGDHEVFVIDRSHGDDLLDEGVLDDWLDYSEPDCVIHLAARAGRVFGEDDPIDFIVCNAGLTTLVARACGERDIRLLYTSTSEVYGDGSDREWMEDDLYISHPHNIYGLSKRWGEEVCNLYAPGTAHLRLSMPFGPGLPPGRGRAAIINILDQARRQEEIPVHRGAERSWCWIGDTVRGIRLVMESGEGGGWNIGRDDNATSMRRVAEIACGLTRAPADLITDIDAPARQTVVKRLSTKRLAGLGWAPTTDLREGMEMTLAWLHEAHPLSVANG